MVTFHANLNPLELVVISSALPHLLNNAKNEKELQHFVLNKCNRDEVNTHSLSYRCRIVDEKDTG